MLEAGLYRTTAAHPIESEALPAGRLVYVGQAASGPFVVVPHYNEKNRWFWREPTVPLTDETWAGSLVALRPEGFYTLPETLDFDGGGRWLANAIVQLGYDQAGQGILFIAERRDTYEDNALYFSDRGKRVEDPLIARLTWAPILPVSEPADGPTRH